MCKSQESAGLRSWGRGVLLGLSLLAGWGMGEGRLAAQPANDNLASPQLITGSSGSVGGANVAATREAGEPLIFFNSGGASVWFRWTAPFSGLVTFDSAGSNFDVMLAAYRNNLGAGVPPAFLDLTKLAEDDDSSPFGILQASMTFNAVAGEEYYITLDGFNFGSGAATGNFLVSWGTLTPSNDDCGNSQVIAGLSGTVTGRNTGATKVPGEPNHAGNAGGASVWYEWTAPIDGIVEFRTESSSFNTLLAVYTGNCDTLTVVAADDDGGSSLTSVVRFNTTAGTVYRIAVDGFNGATGTIVLSWGYQSAAGQFRFASATSFGNTASYRARESESLLYTDTPILDLRINPTGAVFTVTRVNGATGRMLVDYRVAAGGTAIANVDYVASTAQGTLVFDDYQMAASYQVQLITRFPVNGQRTLVMELFNPRPDVASGEDPSLTPALGFPNNAQLTIFDLEISPPPFNSTEIVFYRENYKALEGRDARILVDKNNTGTGYFLRTRLPNADNNVYATQAGSDYATPTLDYEPGWEFNFPNQAGTFIVSIPATGGNIGMLTDSLVEFNEDFVIRLETGNANNPTIHDVATVTILAEHPPLPTGAPLNREQPPGAVDRDHNMDDSLLTTPARNFTPGANGQVFAVATQGDDKTILGGDFTAVNTIQRNRIARLNQDGSLDTTFVPGTGANGAVSAVALQSNGRAIIGGNFTSYNGTGRNRIARLQLDGSLDTTFNPGTGANGQVRAIVVNTNLSTPDFGKIVIGGEFTSVNSTNRSYIARLNINGQMDTSFNPGAGPNAPVRAVAIQRDGKVVIGGEFTAVGGVARNRIARLNADGSLDLSFNPGGAADNTVFAVVMDDSATPLSVSRDAAGNDAEDRFVFDTGTTSGSIQISYDFLQVPDTLRVYYDGVLLFDTGLTNGAATVNIPYGPGNVTQVEIVVNEGSLGIPGTLWSYNATIFPTVGIQRVLIGGAFNTVDFRPRNGVARFNADGSLDTSFDPGAGADNTVMAIVMQPNGRPVIGGTFTSYNLTRRVGVARLYQNGMLDTGFMDTAYNQFAGLINHLSVDPPNFVRSLSIQSDGNLMIGGSFSRVGGGYARDDARPRLNVARLIGGTINGPGNIELVQDQYTVDENAGSVYISLVRTNGTLGAVAATFATADRAAGPGTTTADNDYTPLVSTPLWFSTYNYRGINATRMLSDALDGPNYASFVSTPTSSYGVTTTSNDVQVTVLEDVLMEGDERLNLLLVRPLGTERLFLGGEHIPLGAALGRSKATLTVVENDFQHGIPGFTATNFVVDENLGVVTVTVVRTNGVNGTVTVDYTTEDGTAIGGVSPGPGINYLIRSGRLTFASGQTEALFTVPIVDNPDAAPDRVFNVRLSNVSGGGKLNSSILPNVATVTIIDNDFAPGSLNFAQPIFTVMENGLAATLSVTRTGGNLGAASVVAGTVAGGTAAPADYTDTSVTLTWNDGDSSARSFTVPILDNRLVDGDRAINLALSSALGAQIGATQPTATIQIVNDDSFGQLVFSTPNYTINENGGQVVVTVLRTGGNSGAVSVDATISDGLAVGGLDYTNPGLLTLSFADGQTSTNFAVAVLNDTTQDGNVTFALTLSNPVGGATVGSPGAATVTIVDDESFNLPAGTVDPTFNPSAGADNFIYSAVVQADQRLLVAGDFTVMNGVTRTRIARLLENGQLDPNFDPGRGANGAIRTMAVHPDGVNAGRIVIGGMFTTLQGTNRNFVARLNIDGLLDHDFNPGAGPDNAVFATAIQADGRVLVGGAFATVDSVGRNGIARLQTNGVLDASFNPGAGANGSVFAVAVQTDGKILIGGNFQYYNGANLNYLARLNVDGSLDTTFDPGTGANGPVRAILVQPDGRILVGGSFTSINGVQRHYLARLETTGAVDLGFNTGFDPGSPEGLGSFGANDSVVTLALEPGGKIVVGGNFTTFGGVTRNRLTRLNSDGTVDSTINFGTGANNFVSSVTLQADGKIVAAGGFTAFNGSARNYLVRLHGGTTAGTGTVEFAAPTFATTENAGFTTITVRRRGSAEGTSQVTVEAIDGTATNGVHYVFAERTLSFPPGETLQSFTVQIVDDTQNAPPSRNLTLRLKNFVNATAGPQPTTVLNITNDDGQVGFSSAAYSVNENVVGGIAVITVVRTGTSAGAASVAFLSTTNGTAIPGGNYTPVSGTLSFADGEISKTFGVPILNNNQVQGNRTVELILTNYIGQITPGITRTELTIIDKDRAAGELNFSQANYFIDEGSAFPGTVGLAVISVTRTNGSTGAISVNYFTANGTATGGVIAPPGSGVDYIITSGTLSFADGETNKSFTVPIILDDLSESDETINLTLADPPTGGAELGPQSTARLTIVNNDVLLYGNVRFASTNFNVLEADGQAVITVNRVGGSSNQVSVAAMTADLTGFHGTHYTGVTNTVDLVWTNGETGPKTFTIPVLDNAFVDGNKLVSLILTNVTGGASIGTPGTATLTVQDDDAGPGVLGFALAGFSVLENGTNAVITIARTNGFTGPVSVTFSTTDNTAVAGVDYTNLVQVVSFLDGETNQTVLVGITNNSTQEGNRSLNLTLSAPVGATLGLASASLTIVDDELPAGTTDPGFIPGQGANDTIYAMHVHPVDRTLVLGGDFTLFDTVPRTNVVRLNADGTLDTSLNAGIITQDGTNASVRALAIHTSGANSNKVVIGGLFDRVGTSNRVNVARLNTDGSVDTGFDPGIGANNAVLAVAIQSNGRIVIGGMFTSVNGTNRNYIARLNPDGSLDDTFDPGPGANAAVRAILIDDNGQILIGGDFTSVESITRNGVARLYADGRVDKNFDPGTGANGSVRALALQSDGKLLVGGQFTTLDGVARTRVARLEVNGALDLSFNSATGPDDLVGALALQADGKVLIGGSFIHIGATPSPRVGRLNADGTLDVSFNVGTGANNAVNALVFQNDLVAANSRIIAAGSFTNFNTTAAYRIVRLNGGLNVGAGQFSFGAPTFTVNETGGSAVITVIRTSGLAGTNTVVFSTQDDTATAGFDYTNVVGTLTFLPGQNSTNVAVPVIDNALIDGDRAITLTLSNPLGGATLGSQPSAVLTIVNDDGVVGFSSSAFSVNENVATATITVLRAGGTTAAASVDFTTADGSAQAGFDYVTTAGTLNFAAGQTSASFTVTMINDTLVEGGETVQLTLFNSQPTNSVILGQASATLTIVDDEFQPGVLLFATTNFVVNESAQLASITVLRTNGTSGNVSVDYGTSDGTALAGLDYLAVSGTLSFADGEASKAFLVPIIDDPTVDTNELETVNLTLSNPTGGASLAGVANFGALDTTFNVNQGPDGDVNAVALQPDGRILIGGAFTSVEGVTLGRIARLGVNGSVDSTFDPGVGANGAIQAVAVHTSGANAGRVVVGGSFTSFDTNAINRILRLNADGSRDTNFNVGAGANGLVRAVAISPASSGTNAGKIVIAGDFTTVAGTARNRVARLNADGTLDAAFTVGTGFNNSVHAVAIQGDGSVFVAGTFSTFDTNNNVIRVAHLQADGTLDTNFNNSLGQGPDAAVNAILIQPGGGILIAGAFGTVDGIGRNRIARLANGGTVDPTFDPGAGPNGDINALAIQPDGRILIGGVFTAVGPVSRNGVDRLNANGSRDVSFDPGAGADAAVNAVVVQPDTRIVIGGAFNMFNGKSINRIVRLEAGAAIGLALATLTIVDNDIAIGFSTNDFQVVESGLVQTITVTRSGLSNLTFVVDFTTLDGTAFGGLDYLPTNGSLTFGPNETNKTFEVAILDDLAVEGNEYLNLRLTGTGGANLTGLTNAMMTVLDDDIGYDLAVGVTSVDPLYALREPIYVGSNFAYQVSVTNFGPSWVTGVTLTNALPLNVQFNSQTNSLGLGHVLSGNILTFDLGTLTNGSVASFTIFATATNPVSGFVTNISAVLPMALGLATDANTNNNVATNALFIRDASPFLDIATNRSLTTLTNESQLPANGAIDPGETLTLNLALQNRGNQNTVGNIVATLLATNGVTSPSGAMDYGALAVNQVSIRPFTFTANGTNGETIVLTLQLTDNGVFLSNNIVQVPFTLGASTNFSNTSAIVIPDAGAALQPNYPSTITVSNLGGMVGKVAVTLNNLTHSYPADLDLLLVSPSGEKVIIMSDASSGPGNGVTNLSLTLDQDATVVLPQSGKLTNGTYRPFDYTDPNPDSFPPTAPASPYATDLRAFNGINPNGVWSLYVVDDSILDSGAISNGWTLTLTAISPVSPTAGLSLTMTNATNSVLVGDTIVYTLLVTNHGPETATGIAITNTLPGGVSFVAATNTAGGSFAPVGNTVVFNVGTLLSNQVSTNFLVVIPRVDGTILNQATVSGAQTDPFPPNNSASLSTTVAPSANLLVSLSVNGTIAFGADLTNVITVQNLGPSTASSIIVTSTFPATATFVSGASSQGAVSAPVGNLITASLGNLLSNASATVTLVSRPNSIGSATNTASVGSAVFDANTTNNSASVVSTVNASADLAVAISSTPNPVVVTSNLTYTIAVTNLGLSTATNVVVTDTLPGSLNFVGVAASQGTSANVGGTITCNLGNLALGATATVTIQVRPNAVGPVNNTAFVSATTADPNAANDSATVVTTVNNRSVEIVVAGATLVTELNGVVNGAIDPGETVTIAFGLRNKGGTDTTNLVATLLGTGGVITNSPQVQSFGALAAGGDSRTANFSFTASGSYGDTVLASLELRETGGGANLNLGTVSVPLFLGAVNTFSNTTQILVLDNTQAAPYPSTINVSNISGTIIKVQVTLSSLTHSFPDDLDVLLEGPGGQSMILMSDAGSGFGVGSLTLSFDDAAGAFLPDAALMANGTYKPSNFLNTSGNPATTNDTFVAPAPQPAAGTAYATNLSVFGGTNPNGAWKLYVVDDSSGDSGIINDGWSLRIISVATLNPSVDVAVALTNSPTPGHVGSNLTFTAYVTNSGPNTATNVVLTNFLPASSSFVSAASSQGTFTSGGGMVTFNLGTLLSGARATNTLIVSPTAIPAVTLTSVVSSAQIELISANNTATHTVSVINLPVDLSLSMTGSPNPVGVMSNVTFALVVTNLGPNSAVGVKLTNTLPASVTFVSATGGATNSGNLVAFDLGTLTNGASLTNFIVVRADLVGALTNSALVAITAQTETNLINNVATAVITVEGVQFSSASRVVDGSFQFNLMGRNNMTYVIEVSTNLVNWTPIFTNATLSGALNFIDTNAPNYTSRFYRAVER